MSSSGQNRRRVLVVNPDSQKRMMITMTVAPAVGLSVMMIAVCFFCHQVYQHSIDAGVEIKGLMPLFISVSGFVLVAAAFLVSSALMTSHRIAGPAYRLCQSLKRARDGDIGFTVTLRDADYLTEIRDEMNLFLDVLNENPPSGFKTRAMHAAEQAAAESETEAASVDSVPSLTEVATDGAEKVTTDSAEESSSV
jgi:methyl-accepting chemotaxis protein